MYEQNNKRPSLFTRIGTALGLTAALSSPATLPSCYAPPKISQEDFNAKSLPAKVWDSTVNYGTIDEQVKKAVEDKSIGRGIQAVLTYPADWLLDMGVRTPIKLLYDVPIETWRRINPGNAESGLGETVRALLLPVSAPVCYAYTLGEGVVRHAINAPGETALHTIATAAVGKLWYDEVHRAHSHRRGAGGGGNGGGGNGGPPGGGG